MRMIKILLLAVLLTPFVAHSSGQEVELDKAPIDRTDKESLKRGANSFVEYCLTCHGADFMRYNRHRDIGMSEDDIRTELIHTGQKTGDLMEAAMRKKEAEQWFGVAPPDLSVIARSRGADWLYTYLRTFYQDTSTYSGWNNLTFDKVAMPHVLHHLQGWQTLEPGTKNLVLTKSGTMTKGEYDKFVADLVNYMVYLGEPHASYRKELGVIVLLFLFGMLGLTYLLKKEYWRDIH
ncbi:MULTISPECIES: cytochrome c1 [Nitrosomonas]|uniref:Ubiquinol-cytochrome c reductase cytochrome c1 subunit n=2 Tax=Nitrosomonas eutropha TaxID=916 RepID=A0ABX5M5P9_9PROT|nr:MULTISPECIES: cytochrome c1 [Nitrosomonas]ABI59367.1 cytochrome c1 [Nitrosomonas eutropha C91]MXS81358.1 cytochrome c1 [Nitrosomonas sp. GH22]PXV79776.1 ubiquinol-cytochrome c reductase cytochrome c1 subunit [Nitrosomonas eutropha]SCX25551.1 ubiquinol-cytochrome c reductase cytochrome c1 subunit [Nitrosomonas eutropha]SDW86651.1 ubiquinol-cytochrome c reductase cytochrome c1 subunit [Nitrosomonas eutropha]